VSAAHDSLASALAAAQASYPAIGKGKHSPAFGGYDYADLARVLAAVRPALAAQGIALLQRFDLSEQGDTLLVTELLWRDQRITSRVPLKLAGLDNQKAGSAVTYWRRYSALAICGCAPEDEDDDGASAKDAPTPPARQQARSHEQARDSTRARAARPGQRPGLDRQPAGRDPGRPHAAAGRLDRALPRLQGRQRRRRHVAGRDTGGEGTEPGALRRRHPQGQGRDGRAAGASLAEGGLMRVADIAPGALYEGNAGQRRLVSMICFSRGRSRRSDLVRYGTPDRPAGLRVTSRESFARWAVREAPAEEAR
jgi:hypothetical protein